ncbi:S-adenosyl-L-methionine-dependent methyltransferase [Chloropicon primus]|uniref:Protein arginine methyltransferase NDUFAF7 n=1 Tax=Chloropicon primus TaxID=1764295 RepID=A0A5B8MNP3_9CHLO|nr:S-adenosyl-L-methionine-dependent methyltransferase [Chloropicon primus]UPR01247.1 S-adenosyl-L-methionine-dependent methyltransferase [Chloropicon primus]|eukprot:QDZ22027.1 S-adenosyl-L-methionine-dependent methyltransferase [Chloropicon primus]
MALTRGLAQSFGARGAWGGRLWSSSSSPPCRLVRDHVADVLAHPSDGYFSSRPHVVGKVEEPLSFKTMIGKSGYDYKVRDLYRARGTSWLTPAEIFQPYYGQAVARYLVQDLLERGEQELRVCEIGGGNGTLAANVLDYVRSRHPDLYERTKYTVVDVSKALCERQELLVAGHDELHSSRFTTVAGDAADGGVWRGLVREREGHVYVLGTEILDNLPHDRVEKVGGEWMETWIRYDDDDSPNGREELRPLRDRSIGRCLEAFDWVGAREGAGSEAEDAGFLSSLENFLLSGSAGPEGSRGEDDDEVVFLPTAAVSILESLSIEIPDHTLVLIDFDSLPDVQLRGRNAPLVSNTEMAEARDASTYLVPVGSHDIFFPTNFSALRALYSGIMTSEAGTPGRVSAATRPSSEFFKEFADLQMTTTMSGYNPLIEDFRNTQVFVGQRTTKQ